jgi:hypothetical protein
MTQEWANQLLSPWATREPAAELRPGHRRGQLHAGAAGRAGAGHHHETFHFVLNNTVEGQPHPALRLEATTRRASGTRCPCPRASTAARRRAGPQLLGRGALSRRGGATSASISLLYQPTSWEYVQFLHLANNKSRTRSWPTKGVNLLNAWLNTGMAEPYTLATRPGRAPRRALRRTHQVWWHATNPYFMPGATCSRRTAAAR